MIKKFALLATVAVLFVACSNENTESMEKANTEADTQQLLDQAAEPEVIVVPAVTESEEVIIEESETPVVVEEGVVIEEKN